MKLVYSSNSSVLDTIFRKGEKQKQSQTSIEDLVMQIDQLTERVKQLEVNHAWSEKTLS